MVLILLAPPLRLILGSQYVYAQPYILLITPRITLFRTTPSSASFQLLFDQHIRELKLKLQ